MRAGVDASSFRARRSPRHRRRDAQHAEPVRPRRAPPGRRDGAGDGNLRHGMRVRPELAPRRSKIVPLRLLRHDFTPHEAQDDVEGLQHAIALFCHVDAEHEGIGREEPGAIGRSCPFTGEK